MSAPRRRRARRLLPAVLVLEPRYRLLFAGQALSILGDRMTYIALAFATLQIGSVTDLGWVTTAAALPFLFVAIPAGALSDRLGRRRVMIAADLVRASTQALLAALLLSGVAEIWMLIVLMACFGTADAFFGPALQGLLPQTVDVVRVQDANAVLAFASNSGAIAGPAIAGLLIAASGPGEAIAVDAATFLASALCLWRLRPATVVGADESAPDDLLAGLHEGWAIVRSSGWILPGLGALVAYQVLVLPSVFVLGPAIAQRDLGGAAAWATIATGFGIGAVLGSVIALRLRPRHLLRASITAMLVASLQGAFVASGASAIGIAALEVAGGIGVSIFWTYWETTLQEQVPQAAVSRVSAYDWAVTVGLMPVGLALAGPIGAAIGIEQAMRWGTALAIVAALCCLAVPAVRRLERPAAAIADA